MMPNSVDVPCSTVPGMCYNENGDSINWRSLTVFLKMVTVLPGGGGQWPQLQPGEWSAHAPGPAAAWPALLLAPPPASPAPQLR